MALTKPAGVFLQLLSIPLIFGGCMVGLGDKDPNSAAGTWGWFAFGLGVVLLWWGGTAARRRKE